MKKKINSGDKGKRTERELCKILSDKFNESFSRTIGSGNRWGQVSNMPAHARETFASDIVCPVGFGFCIESKGGYDDIDLNLAFDGGNSQIDEFIEQVVFESERCGRKPMVVWKKSRRPWLVIIKTEDLPHLNWNYRFIYREWSFLALNDLLQLPREFFFVQQ